MDHRPIQSTLKLTISFCVSTSWDWGVCTWKNHRWTNLDPKLHTSLGLANHEYHDCVLDTIYVYILKDLLLGSAVVGEHHGAEFNYFRSSNTSASFPGGAVQIPRCWSRLLRHRLRPVVDLLWLLRLSRLRWFPQLLEVTRWDGQSPLEKTVCIPLKLKTNGLWT